MYRGCTRDLVVKSASDVMITDLKVFLKEKYVETTLADGPLGMVFDLSTSGQVKMTMKGYVEDTRMLISSVMLRALPPTVYSNHATMQR